MRRGYELNYKLICVPVARHGGTLAPEHSFVQISPDNVIVTALKKAEDENELVLRFYEWAGKERDVKVQFPVAAESASETNLIEKPRANLHVDNGALVLHTKPYEIKTVKVRFASKSRNEAERAASQ